MFGWFKKRKAASTPPSSSPRLIPLVLSATPDAPQGFGYKTIWVAVRGAPSDLAQALDLKNPIAANWAAGLATAYGHGQDILARPFVFVSPLLGEWTLAVSFGLPEFDMRISPEQHWDYAARGERFEKFKAMIEALATRFDDVLYFGTHRVVECHAWARAQAGKIVRMFGFLGESGEVVANFGAQTAQEAELGFPDLSDLSLADATDRSFELEDGMPGEDWVVRLAGVWSIDPTTLEGAGFPAATGLLGQLPDRFWQGAGDASS